MATVISRLAQVDPAAEIDADVQIGPFCLIGPHVRLGAGTRLDSHVAIVGHTTIGRNNRFFPHCVIGAEPQDYSYSGAPTQTVIGDGNLFREGVTVNRGAEKEDHVTRIGDRNMLMANCHVAHNCQVRNNVVLVNGVLLGGHVHVHDGAIISGNSVVHHFATLGTLSFVSGGSRVPTDVPPYMLAAGSDDPRILTINLVGMQRNGVSPRSIEVVKQAHRMLFRNHQPLDAVREAFLRDLTGPFPAELATLLDFIEHQQAGRKGRAGEARRDSATPAPATTPRATPDSHSVHEHRRAA